MAWYHAFAQHISLLNFNRLRRRAKSRRTSGKPHAQLSAAPQYHHAALIEPLEQRQLLAVDFGQSADVNLVSDVTLGAPVQVGSFAFFVHGSTATGGALWKTDGTSSGTQIVFDPASPAGGEDIRDLTNVNGTLYFVANHGAAGWTVWKTDGTSAGTSQVSSFTGVDLSHIPAGLTNVGGYLYFAGNATKSSPRALWKSDPSTAIAIQVSAASGSTSSEVVHMTDVSGRLFFNKGASGSGAELWTTTPTSSTAALVNDIFPGSPSGNPSRLTNAGGTLIFSVRNSSGYEPWISDGTSAGTFIIRDIRPGSSGSFPSYFTYANGVTFFFANDGTNGQALWTTDGTCAGTTLVSDIRPDTGYWTPGTVGSVAGGRIVFSADDLSGVAGKELWVSDGTSSGTTLLKDIRPGSAGSEIGPGASHNGLFYFTANDGVNGAALWRTDGTASGTQLVADIDAELVSGQGSIGFLNGQPLFRADGHLYVVDGSPEGASRLTADDYLPSKSSDPAVLGGFDNGVVFAANDGITGVDPWFSDGTAAGTFLLKDITVSSSTPLSGAKGMQVGNTFYFTQGNYFTDGNTIWSTDGTSAGTAIAATIPVTSNSSSVPYYGAEFIDVIGDKLIFAAVTSTTGSVTQTGPSTFVWGAQFWSTLFSLENGLLTALGPASYRRTSSIAGYAAAGPGVASHIWYDGRLHASFLANPGVVVTDGTVAGTTNVSPSGPYLDTSDLAPFQGALFVVAGVASLDATGVAEEELWRYDAHVGFTLVKDIKPGTSGSFARRLTPVGDTLFFVANDGATGHELWKSDGTGSGTVLVKDIRPGASDSNGVSLNNVAGRLVFFANDGTGTKLWSSDGTSGGTNALTSWTATATEALVHDGALYFLGNDGVSGAALWRTDGTVGGTFPITPATATFGGVSTLSPVDGRLFFTATDAAHGKELWSTDGTSSGTAIFHDIRPGPNSSNPTGLTNAGGQLWFAASDGIKGNELWRYARIPPVAQAGASQTISAGSPLTLSAAASYSPVAGASIVSYSWDVNGDGTFGDATGVNPTLSWSQLLSLGVGAGIYNVRVRVTDNETDSADSSPVTLTVTGGFVTAVGADVYVYGTGGPDTFTFGRSGLPNKTNITVNGTNFGVWTVGSGGSVLFYGFDGADSVDFRGTTGGDTFDLNGATVGVNGLTHTGSGVEYWTYTGNGGSDAFNVLAVSLGQIVGGSGSDTVSGPAGDQIWMIDGVGTGGVGGPLSFREVESLVGNGGNDRFVVRPAGQFAGNINGGGGSDTLDYSESTTAVTINLAASTAPRIGSFSGIENAMGGSGDDTLIGDANNNELYGNGGSDTLIGNDGHDTLWGGSFFDVVGDANDSLDGGNGNDSLTGSRGSDTLRGGAGDDQLLGGSWIVTDPDDGDFVHGDAGVDSLFGAAGNDRLEGGTENDLLVGGLWDTSLADGNDTLLGELGDDVLLGGQGSDWLDGGAGVDWLFGGWWDLTPLAGDGDDVLLGGADNDFLFDVAGRDLLVGGLGVDSLFGGTGDDLLVSGELNFPAAQRDAAVAAIMAEWTGGSDYATRVSRIGGAPGGLNAGYYLTAATVQNDSALERLFGQANDDWFVVELLDITGDRSGGESRTDL